MPLPEPFEEAEGGASPFSVPQPEPSSATVYQLRPTHRMAEPITLRIPPPAPAEGWAAAAAVENDRIAPNSQSMSMATEGDVRAAEIAASEARSETKIARLEGKIDAAVATLLGEMHAIRDDVRQSDQYNRDSRWVLFVTVVTAALALGGLAIGLATYGDALFGRGMSVRDVIQSTIKDYEAQKKSAPEIPAPTNPGH